MSLSLGPLLRMALFRSLSSRVQSGSPGLQRAAESPALSDDATPNATPQPPDAATPPTQPLAELLQSSNLTLALLQARCLSGGLDDAARPLAWRLLLGALPIRPSDRGRAQERNLTTYTVFLEDIAAVLELVAFARQETEESVCSPAPGSALEGSPNIASMDGYSEGTNVGLLVEAQLAASLLSPTPDAELMLAEEPLPDANVVTSTPSGFLAPSAAEIHDAKLSSSLALGVSGLESASDAPGVLNGLAAGHNECDPPPLPPASPTGTTPVAPGDACPATMMTVLSPSPASAADHPLAEELGGAAALPAAARPLALEPYPLAVALSAVETDCPPAALSRSSSTPPGHGGHTRPDTNSSGSTRHEEVDLHLLQQIDKDLERTHADLAWFNDLPNLLAMRRVLLTFAKLNGGVGYVQGMNELLAPLWWVFARGIPAADAAARASAEADLFFAFMTLMSEVRDLFIVASDHSQSGVRATVARLGAMLARREPEVAAHFAAIRLDVHMFAYRWVTTLLSREFCLPDTVCVWDALLADPARGCLTGLLSMSVAMIRVLREPLCRGAFPVCVKMLQSYPPGQDVACIIRTAAAIRLEEESTDTPSSGGSPASLLSRSAPAPGGSAFVASAPGRWMAAALQRSESARALLAYRLSSAATSALRSVAALRPPITPTASSAATAPSPRDTSSSCSAAASPRSSAATLSTAALLQQQLFDAEASPAVQ